VIVDVFTIGWSMPSISTQLPAGTRLTSTLYLEHRRLIHECTSLLQVWLIPRLFKDTVSTVYFIKCQMRQEDNHRWWVCKCLEGDGHDQFESSKLAFTWRDIGTPWKTSIRIDNSPT
jgi:hypothetical protein